MASSVLAEGAGQDTASDDAADVCRGDRHRPGAAAALFSLYAHSPCAEFKCPAAEQQRSSAALLILYMQLLRCFCCAFSKLDTFTQVSLVASLSLLVIVQPVLN